MSLAAIFYARFHPERGPCVIEQYPAGSIATRSTKHEHTNGEGENSSATSLIDFSEISSYIIPPYELCGKSLSICCHGSERENTVRGRYRVLGWSISLESEQYARNRFTFNVCFVLREDEDNGNERGGMRSIKNFGVKSWGKLVKKTALFFQTLEVEDGVLAAEDEREDVPNSSREKRIVGPLLEKLFEQLTCYEEVCVRVSDIHSLNLRLEAHKPPAPKIKAWDVPLLVRSLPSPKDWSCDLTLARIHPHVDGINHVAKIAEKADVELKLVKRAVRGLLYYGRVRMLDIFHFQAIYALTADFTWFVRDEEMQEECRRYVSVITSATNGRASATDQKSPPTSTRILNLYTTLTHPPQPLHTSLLANDHLLTNPDIDIRRLITYGILKGFLRRVHKYALLVATPSGSTSQVKLSGAGSGLANSGSKDATREFERAWRKAALSSGWATPPLEVGSLGVENGEDENGTPSAEKREKGSLTGGEKVRDDEGEVHANGEVKEVDEEEETLRAFLDGKHCLDEICVAMRMSERKLLDKLRSGRWSGEVVVFCK